MKNLEQEIKNKEAHYSVLRGNLVDAAKELTALFTKTDEANEELIRIQDLIAAEKEQLAETTARCDLRLNDLAAEESSLETRRSVLAEEDKAHKATLIKAEEAVREQKVILLDIVSAVGTANQTLAGINSLIKKREIVFTDIKAAESVLAEMDKKLLVKKEEIAVLGEEYNKREQELDIAEADRLAQLKETEDEIFVKQRSLDAFGENKRREEKNLLEKRKDLSILEGRLRKHYQILGQNFIL